LFLGERENEYNAEDRVRNEEIQRIERERIRERVEYIKAPRESVIDGGNEQSKDKGERTVKPLKNNDENEDGEHGETIGTKDETVGQVEPVGGEKESS
jgi:hypothetical protein